MPRETAQATALRELVRVRIEGLAAKFPSELSGGEQQRVAIARALCMSPKLMLFDEPTSALDPVAAEEVLAALHRLVHDLGYTVVLAEHRLERVVQHADRIVLVRDGVVSALLQWRPSRAFERDDGATAPVPSSRRRTTTEPSTSERTAEPGETLWWGTRRRTGRERVSVTGSSRPAGRRSPR
jgi:energy-coupling factor transport system ATP-binding protein